MRTTHDPLLLPKRDHKPAGDDQQSAGKNRGIRPGTEREQIYDLRSDEKEHDVSAEQAAEVGWSRIDENSVGKENQTAERDRHGPKDTAALESDANDSVATDLE